MTRMLKNWRSMTAIAVALGTGFVAAQVAVGGGLTALPGPASRLFNPFHPTLEPVPTAPLLRTQHMFDAAPVGGTSAITADPSLSGPTSLSSSPAISTTPIQLAPTDPIVAPVIVDPITITPVPEPILVPPVRDPSRPPTRSPFRP